MITKLINDHKNGGCSFVKSPFQKIRFGLLFVFLGRYVWFCVWACMISLCPSKLQAFDSQNDHTVIVEVNKAREVQGESAITDVFIANPEIADVQASQGRDIFVYGKKTGVTSLYLTYASGFSSEITVEVTQNLTQLRRLLKQSFPQENIDVKSSPKGIVLSGKITASKVMKDAQDIAEQFVQKDEKIINNMTLSTANQVYLKVRVAEVNRNVLSRINPSLNISNTDFGSSKVAFATLTGRNPVAAAGAAGGLISRPTSSVESVAGTLGLRFNDQVSDHTAIFDLLDQEGLGTILAEPNLVALSGQKASFLVGGEVSYPVPQDNQNVTIEFKPYGISLEFTPTVLSPDLINLQVTPEVSELDDTRTSIFQVAGANISVPSIRTRRASTTVELSSGQTFAIAGLLSHTASNQNQEVPGLSKLPILGALFTSSEFQRNETELVITVTPYLVSPTQNKNIKIPNSGIIYANSAEMLFSKQLNKRPVSPGAGGNPTQEGVHLAAGLHAD